MTSYDTPESRLLRAVSDGKYTGIDKGFVSTSDIASLLSEKAELEREVERLRDALMDVYREIGGVVSNPLAAGKIIRQALSPNNPAGQAMEGDHG